MATIQPQILLQEEETYLRVFSLRSLWNKNLSIQQTKKILEVKLPKSL